MLLTVRFIDRFGRRVLWLQGLIGMLIWFTFIAGLSVSRLFHTSLAQLLCDLVYLEGTSLELTSRPVLRR